MRSNVVPFPGEDLNRAGSGGDGPEDPMLEARVGRLEEKFDRIEAAVLRIDARLDEFLHTCAKQADMHKLQLDVVELKTTNAKQADLMKVQADVAEIKGRLAGVEGRLGTVEGRIAGVEGRFNQVPTIWGMLGLIATLLIGLAGLMFTAGKFLHS